VLSLLLRFTDSEIPLWYFQILDIAEIFFTRLEATLIQYQSKSFPKISDELYICTLTIYQLGFKLKRLCHLVVINSFNRIKISRTLKDICCVEILKHMVSVSGLTVSVPTHRQEKP